jgi:hypothetical protein
MPEKHMYADEKAKTNGHINGAEIDFRTESEDSPPAPTLEDIETDFWERGSLKAIYSASLSQMCSPWAVLAYCAARALALVRPNAVLPALVGGPGSLNWFCAIAAISGGGKSASSAVARALVDSQVLQRNLGSGEGLIDAYVKPSNKETGEPKGLHESVMFLADEIQSLSALGNRSGATLMPILRSAFSGDTIGFSYRQASDQHLEAHTYRMTLAVNVQPAKAGALTDDEYGGTLQRFMWFPGQDSRISATVKMTGVSALTLPPHSKWLYPRELRIPDAVTRFIRDERAKFMRGEKDPLNGHGPFIREKFAFALAVLDGRDEMSLDDWRLAGIAMAVSDHTRGWVTEQLDAAEKDEATKRGTLQGVSFAAANVSKAQEDWKRTRRIENWVMDKLIDAGSRGISEGELRRAARSTDRHSIAPTLTKLAEAGAVEKVEEGSIKWRYV